MSTTKWIKSVRSILSSLADVVGDWIFYLYGIRDNDRLTNFEIPVIVCACFSMIFAFLTIYREVNTHYCIPTAGPGSRRGEAEEEPALSCIQQVLSNIWSNKLRLANMLLEDIPQIVMSIWVRVLLGGWQPATVLNLTTSSYNFILDTLDMLDDDIEPPPYREPTQDNGNDVIDDEGLMALPE